MFLLFQEELAFVYEMLGVYDESLVQYDELDALFTQFVLNSNLSGKSRIQLLLSITSHTGKKKGRKGRESSDQVQTKQAEKVSCWRKIEKTLLLSMASFTGKRKGERKGRESSDQIETKQTERQLCQWSQHG